ncbi:MAG: type II toxin-antitoxin system ParD family antitoxin [Gammaproteobacteria bacterium]|nr:type II toxin-antitoxin system ParD family antitoxin [Gammaproteobacteria bacterium]MDD9800738.1 type II toxin-antitoxin system ParD family antitoxin [Gammaproteobacteria bacterium]MDD9815118.1 type II toxin-antitoxin system ParD family antitoxin [Gammaproteobacteria bacterium]MDD9851107.1 type II toxin-antitoxin system ParD family antitoxin [Gammaproteobacteria bacterium]MDD9869957.1 type II toxin-antitoxin system ParD family antitoxin [Gammaproteobacteria bacterium]
MSTILKPAITLTDKESEWVQNQIASGQYADDSAYFRDLVRRDREYQTKLEALRKEIEKGLDSGFTDCTFEEAWAQGEREGLKILAGRKHAQSGGG